MNDDKKQTNLTSKDIKQIFEVKKKRIIKTNLHTRVNCKRIQLLSIRYLSSLVYTTILSFKK